MTAFLFELTEVLSVIGGNMRTMKRAIQNSHTSRIYVMSICVQKTNKLVRDAVLFAGQSLLVNYIFVKLNVYKWLQTSQTQLKKQGHIFFVISRF